MTDARLEAAQRTNQGGERGWSFDPSPERKPTSAWTVMFVLVACPLAFLAAWVML